MYTKQQSAILAEARRWINTPYHHAADIRGVGVDCLMLLCCVYSAAGVAPWADPRPYPQDWMLHRSEELYLLGLEKYATPIPDGETPQPGDILTFKFGRTYSHAAIVTDWPNMIHAFLPAGIVTTDTADAPAFAGRRGTTYRVNSMVTA